MTNPKRNGNSRPPESEDFKPDMIDHALFYTALGAAEAFALAVDAIRFARKGIASIAGGVRSEVDATTTDIEA